MNRSSRSSKSSKSSISNSTQLPGVTVSFYDNVNFVEPVEPAIDSVSISVNSKRTWPDNNANRRSWSPDMAAQTDHSDRTSPSIRRVRATLPHHPVGPGLAPHHQLPDRPGTYSKLCEESDEEALGSEDDLPNDWCTMDASTSQGPSPRPNLRVPTRDPSNMSLGGSVVNLAPWEKRFTSTKEVFADFCARTSSHGIPHIGESYTIAGKLFWTVVFATCFLAFSMQTYWTVMQFFEYKTIIEMQLVFQAAPFPAVTVCNLNPYKQSLVQGIPEIHKSLLVYEQNIVRARQKQNSKVTGDIDKAKKAAPILKRSVDPIDPPPLSTHSDYYVTKNDTTINTTRHTHTNTSSNIAPTASTLNRTKHFYSLWPPYERTFNSSQLEPDKSRSSESDDDRYRREPDAAGRDKRQLVHEPVYATCVCKDGQAESCLPHYDQDKSIDAFPLDNKLPDDEQDEANEFRTVCMCFESSDNRNAPWPCYPTGRWHERRCFASDCDNTRNCRSDLAMLDNQVPKGMATLTCLCQDVSKNCVLEPDDGVIRWFNPKAQLHTVATTGAPESTTTPNPKERQALGLEDLNDKGAITTKTKENIMFVVAALDDDIRMNVSHTLDELVLRCSFNGKDCDTQRDFKLTADPMYGNCYTFNYHINSSVYNTRGGPMYGLRLLLDVKQPEYLPYTEAAGIRMVVHDPHDEPFPDTFGYSAPVGFISSFGIKMKNIVRLGRPYTNCTMAKERIEHYIYEEWYSSEGCYRNCFQHMVLRDCGCGDPRFPVPHGQRPCHAYNPEERGCLSNFSSHHGSFHGMPGCECEQPCSEIIYETAYAAAAWPAENFITGECPEELDANDTWGCTDHYRRNTAYIEVYYEQLNFENLRETQAYSLINLVADFGGNIGLWIGFSVITMIEILELCIELFYLCYFRRNREEERKRRIRNRMRMRQNLQYLNRFTEFASAAPMTVQSEEDEPEEGTRPEHMPLSALNSQDSAVVKGHGKVSILSDSQYQLSQAQVLSDDND